MGKQKLIFLPPPFTSTYFTYQNVNADPKLRKDVTDHFFDLINKGNILKKYKKILSTREGYELIYKILRRFTKKYDINWYDLRGIEADTMDYLITKIPKVLK